MKGKLYSVADELTPTVNITAITSPYTSLERIIGVDVTVIADRLSS